MSFALRRTLPAAILASVLPVAPTRAADYFWNPGVGTGSTDWTSNPNWSTPGNGPIYSTNWADNNTANFTGTGQTITVNSNVSAAGINFTANNVSVAAGAGTLALTGQVSVSATNSATIAGVIGNGGGTTALTKQGTGTLVLSGANIYTGATTINEGTLRLDSAGALGSAGTISFGGGTLQFTTNNTTDYSSRFSTAAGQQYRFDTNGQSVTLAGNLASAGGSLNKLNSGTLTLSGSNAFTGGVTITNGRLVLNNANALGSSGSITFAGGTMVFTANNTLDYSSRFTGTGTQTYQLDTNGQTVTLASNLAGANIGLTKAGAGTLILSGANTYGQATNIFNGTLQIGNGGATGSITSNVIFTALTPTLAFNRSDALTYSGTISESGGIGQLLKSGTGTLTLSGSNTYTGATTINGGTISVAVLANGGSASGIGASSNAASNLQFNGGTLRYTGVGSVSTDRAFTLNAGGGTIEVFNAAPTLVVSGGGTGAGGLTKTGDGVLILTGTYDYAGGTTVTDGVLRIGNGIDNGSVTGNVLNNATLQFNNPSATTFAGDISGTGGVSHLSTGTLTLTGALTNAGTTTVNAGTLQIGNGGATGSITTGVSLSAGSSTLAFNRSTDLTYTGTVSGSGQLVKSGDGALTLGGANSYSGITTINAGTVLAPVLADTNANSSLGTGAGGGIILGGGTLEYTGSGASSNRSISLNAGTSTISNTGTGPLNLTNVTVGTNGSGVVTLVLNAANTGGNNTFAGGLTQNGGGTTNLSKTGAGTWVLTSPSLTYNGTTTVSGGGLYVNGTKSGAGTVTAQAGGTLGGTGSVAGAVAFNSGATFDIGDGSAAAAIGDITLSNTLSLQGGSTMRVDVRNASTPTAGTTYDQAAVGGLVSLGGMLDVEYDPTGGGAGYTLATRLTIISTPGLVNGVFSNYADLAAVPELNGLGGFNWYIDYQNNVGVFFAPVNPVPEPASVLGVAAAGLGLAGWVRRRRAGKGGERGT